ncbi:MAG: dicarboxylate/amino acid:cation symporter [Candidatus Omnitrophica bacterium]|nr:dicarboxylate/amino acid:cation symporter [Candidatus Omnitrophota bacterium]
MTIAENKAKKAPAHWLLSPWAILAGIILGCVIGIKFKSFAIHLTIFADIFLALMQMCVIPILVTAVVSSLARLVAKQVPVRFLTRLVLFFVFGLIFTSLVGLAVGYWGQPGKGLDTSSRITIGQAIAQYEVSTGNNDTAATEGFFGFLKGMVPANIFSAFSQGHMLAILFFCVFLGIALGLVRTPAGKVTLSVIAGLYEAFQRLFSWIMYVLPFGLCFLFASQISHAGLDIFKTLIKFVLLFYLSAVLLILFYNTLIWWRRGGPFFGPVMALREVMVVALGTSSSFASMPSAMRCLHENLKVDKDTANLVIPVGISIHRQGNAMYFVLAIMLIAQLYDVSLGAQGIMIALVGSILAAMGAGGVPGPAQVSVLAFVLASLGLPVQTALMLLIAIDPITDPVFTTVNIFANCTVTALMDEPGALKKDTPESLAAPGQLNPGI